MIKNFTNKQKKFNEKKKSFHRIIKIRLKQMKKKLVCLEIRCIS